MNQKSLIIRYLGIQPYLKIWQAMQDFTNQRTSYTPDEVWLLEHDPIFTLGQRTKPEHLLNMEGVQVIQTDRGGQATYHGPGQLIAYVLLDLKRNQFNVRQLVTSLEETLIELIEHFGHKAYAKAEAPGVYINEAKIGSVGLRIRRGQSYHGLSMNINMDLSPFARINPCGFNNLKITQLSDLVSIDNIASILPRFCAIITNKLHYPSHTFIEEEVLI